MSPSDVSTLTALLQQPGSGLLDDWMKHQAEAGTLRADMIGDSELREQARELLQLIAAAAPSGDRIDGPAWQPVRQFLASISTSRAAMGFSPRETAAFVLSLKQPLFDRLQAKITDARALGSAMWGTTTLIDALGLYTTEAYLAERERLISRQQEDMLELSTPVVKLWEGILALPMIGTLDSARTQVVMEALLQRIVETGAEVAIIDITGVPTVDTLVAQHLIKTVTAARLMGADCIISGIRPQIAATIVHLGVDLSNIDTKATLADAFMLALRRTGHALGRAPARDRADA